MQTIKTFIYQTQQIRELEMLAQQKFNLSGEMMMQRAGKSAFEFLQKRWPQARNITICCGSGNNGGDGYVLALHAHQRGLAVNILQVGNQQNIKDEAKKALEMCKNAGISIQTIDANSHLQRADIFVDAICGIGLHDELRPEILAIIKKIQALQTQILSLDIPTGVDADTGKILGAALHATATITFIGYKLGLLTGEGVACTGELICSDLQFPPEIFSLVEPTAEKINLNCYSSLLKPRARDWHKGLSGHVLIVGGELGYSGAPRMAAEAALRVGAGLVSVATRPENALTMNLMRPEIMCHGVSNANELSVLIQKANVIVLGPGLGQSDWSKKLFEEVCHQTCPIVVDADGLNLLADQKIFKNNWVLTPHPGEAARLLGVSIKEIQQDRLAASKKIHTQFGGVCVLKGAGSLVADANSMPSLCAKGNPGMATAGMGDVLSGVIGSLIAQNRLEKNPLSDSAKLGVGMHARAGDLTAAKKGERGMLALDLMPYLRLLSNPK